MEYSLREWTLQYMTYFSSTPFKKDNTGHKCFLQTFYQNETRRTETLLMHMANNINVVFLFQTLFFISPIKAQSVTRRFSLWPALLLWDLLSAKWIVLLEAHQLYLWAVSTWQVDSHFKAWGRANVLINSSVSLMLRLLWVQFILIWWTWWPH